MIAAKRLEFTCRSLGIGNDPRCGEQSIDHPPPVTLDRLDSAELGMRQWNEVVNEIDRLDVAPPRPIEQTRKIDIGVPDVDVKCPLPVDRTRCCGNRPRQQRATDVARRSG